MGTAFQQVCGAPCVQEDARSLRPVACSRKATMIGDELRMHHHVTVEHHDVVAGQARQGQIARPAESKSLVRLPAVGNRSRELPGEVSHEVARLGAGTIVRDGELIRQIALSLDAPQHASQRVGAVERRDDQRELHSSAGRHCLKGNRHGAGNQRSCRCAPAADDPADVIGVRLVSSDPCIDRCVQPRDGRQRAPWQ